MPDHVKENAGGKLIASHVTRAYLYGIGVAASPLAVAYGIVTENQAGLWISLFGAVLGLTNAVALANTGVKK